MSHANYMNRAFAERFALVSEADELLANVEFDTFVGIGVSGTLVAPLLADMGKGNHGFAIVRKSDSSHSYHTIEGDLSSGNKFVFVDDFVNSGKTLSYVIDRIEKEFSYPHVMPIMVGAYLYQDKKFYTVPQLIESLALRTWRSDYVMECIERLENMLP